MTAVPHGFDRTGNALPWRARLSAVLREFWDVMRATHHARIPS